MLTEGVETAVNNFWQNVDYRYEQRRHDLERPLLAPDKLFLTSAGLQSYLSDYPRVELQHFKFESAGVNYPIAALPSLLIHQRQEQPILLLINFLKELKGRVLFYR